MRLKNGRADGGVSADAMALEPAGGCSVRLDLVTIFARSIAGRSEGDQTLEDGEAAAGGNPPLMDRANAGRRASRKSGAWETSGGELRKRRAMVRSEKSCTAEAVPERNPRPLQMSTSSIGDLEVRPAKKQELKRQFRAVRMSGSASPAALLDGAIGRRSVLAPLIQNTVNGVANGVAGVKAADAAHQ